MVDVLQWRVDDVVELLPVALEQADRKAPDCTEWDECDPAVLVRVGEGLRCGSGSCSEDLHRDSGDMALGDLSDEGLVSGRGSNDEAELLRVQAERKSRCGHVGGQLGVDLAVGDGRDNSGTDLFEISRGGQDGWTTAKSASSSTNELKIRLEAAALTEPPRVRTVSTTAVLVPIRPAGAANCATTVRKVKGCEKPRPARTSIPMNSPSLSGFEHAKPMSAPVKRANPTMMGVIWSRVFATSGRSKRQPGFETGRQYDFQPAIPYKLCAYRGHQAGGSG